VDTFKILVVDDSTDSLELISYILKKAGYQVVTCESGVEAVKKALYFEPDLVLLDINMESLDGWVTSRLLKKLPLKYPLKVILMTALHEAYKDRNFGEIGADGFISKGIKPKELIGYLAGFLAQAPLLCIS
jgi:two-component system, OmpR family, alkaline phosphatase synthesis response regulator PhoP